MNSLDESNEVKEVSLIEFIQEIFKFAFKYKKMIGTTIITGALIGGLTGLKLDKANRYYKQEIAFHDSNIAQGKNPDGTKFDERFLIEGTENLAISGGYPTYTVTTQKGFKNDKEREELEKVVNKNKKWYLEKYLPLNKFNRKFDEKEQKRIKKHDYRDFYDIIMWYINIFNSEFSKSKIYSNPGTDYRNIEKRVVENLTKYKLDVDKGPFSRNAESAKKYYEMRIENIEKSKKIKEERFSSLNFVLGILGEKNIKIEPKAEITKGLTYERAVSEYAQLLWDINSNKQNIAKLKEEFGEVKFPSNEMALELEKLEDNILKDTELLVKEANFMLEKIVEEKIEEFIKEEPVVLVREKKIELLILLGIILGGILGFSIAGYKELMIYKRKD